MGLHFLTNRHFRCIVTMPLLPSHPSPSYRRGRGLGGCPSPHPPRECGMVFRHFQRGLGTYDQSVHSAFDVAELFK